MPPWTPDEDRGSVAQQETYYSVGIPAAVTVKPDGSVVIEFDLSEVGCSILEDEDAAERYPDAVVIADKITIEVATASLRETHSVTIA
jgi:hypothetical protein